MTTGTGRSADGDDRPRGERVRSAELEGRAARLGAVVRSRVTAGVRSGAEDVLRGGLDQLVRRNLRGVWTSGVIPAGPAVWAANHHSWWDFFVAAAALRSRGRDDVGVLMDASNVGRRALYDRVGVVPTDRLRTAVDMLRSGMVLVVFPEGRLWPSGPLRETAPGARWLADRSGAALHAVATRVTLRAQQAPEAYLDISPGVPSASSGVDQLTGELARRLADLDAALATADPERPLPGFDEVVSGVRSWNERFNRRAER